MALGFAQRVAAAIESALPPLGREGAFFSMFCQLCHCYFMAELAALLAELIGSKERTVAAAKK